MKKILLMLIVLAGFSVSLVAQKVVTGKVTDENQAPLAGVSVMVKGTTVGTLTNVEGTFSLSIPENAKILSFSFIGMKSNDLEIGDQTTVNVVMSIDVGLLEEVIVIGYGTVKKKDLTGAVTRINAEELKTEATSNMTSILRGSIPGLNVSMNTTAKGLSSPRDMMIRGETSLRAVDANGTDQPQRDANAPLIVVDGMIYYGDLADINPQDIESFDVLKDASSAAIYGARASNGVVIITTKKGSKGKPVININTSTGMAYASPASLDLMNGEQFIARRIAGYEANERRQTTIGAGYYTKYDNLPSGVTLDQWKAYDGSAAATDLDAIWLNRIGFAPIEVVNYEAGNEMDYTKYMRQKGLTQDYTMSVSNATDAVSYYFSLGYTNNEGIRYNESFNTYRSRINLETTITSWLKVGTNTQIALRDESPIVVGRSFYVTPYSSMYEADGTTLLFAPSGYINAPNPLLELEYHDQFIKYNTLNSKLYATLSLPFGFSFTSEFIPRFNWNRDYQSFSSGHALWLPQGGRASRQNTTIFEWQVNNMLKWNKTFDIHAFDVTLVQTAEKYQYWRDYMYRQRFLPSDVLGYHRMQAAAEDLEISSNDEVSTGDALLARVNYTMAEKYNLTASFRRDGYSAFGQSNPRASFWSVAGGWTISKENFFTVTWVDQLKLRLSYGTNGNRGVGIYDALSNLNTGKFVLISGTTPSYVSQLYTSRMANPNLKWERTSAYNIGLDFAIFKGRLTGNIEGYYMITKDLLIPRQLPNITGYASVMSNMGQVDNKGIEISLNSVNISTQDLTWSTDFSLAHNRNKIVHLFGDYSTDPITGETKEVDDITNQWFIGHAVDQIWDYKILGIWQTDEAAEATTYSRNPGDYKLEDVNGDGYYTDADKSFQGYKRPIVRLTLRNTVQYKDFELSVKMYSYLGHFKDDYWLRNNEAFYDRSTFYNVPYWTPDNPGNKWARIDSYETGFSVWENNSFVRIDNVSLSYNVPQSFLNKLKIVACRLSIVSENPLVWAPGWSWMDPEEDEYIPSYLSFKLNITL
ncbi:MAG: SusC/RagA family TonB-linked outer membrane protein [Bacteroidia bacterium]|nr:SusC/RagA family TonB-linked outer membrane protein [Bacteroidia bacterium]